MSDSNIVRVTIISAVYPPEPQVTARMSFDLANHLMNQGCAVTVICPQPSRVANIDNNKYHKYDSTVVSDEKGIRVVRLPSYTSPKSKLFPRMRESFSFGKKVAKCLSTLEATPDVLYVNSWPLLSQAIISEFARRNAIPLVLQVMDVYPEALTRKLPSLLRSLVHTPLKWLDGRIAQSAAAVVVISDNMSQVYTEDRHVSADHIVTIPTWQDETVYVNIPSREECCHRYEISQHLFTFLYLGNIGPVAGVDFLIRAFAECNVPDAQLVIVGDGTAKPDCVALASRCNLKNVHFVSDPESAHVPLLQGMAHVCMLPMKRGAGMSSIPSKLPAYLFSAKPVIATVDCESDTARFVREADCGWVGDAEDVNWLVATMREVIKMPAELLESIGQRGHRFGLTNFSKSSGVALLANTILRTVGVNQ